MKKIVDARGMACPLPVVHAKNAAEALNPGDTLVVLVDNEIAVQNLQRFAGHKGFSASGERKGEAEFVVTMHIRSRRKPPAPRMPGEREAWWYCPPTAWAPGTSGWANR